MYIGENTDYMIVSEEHSGHAPPSVYAIPFSVSVWLQPDAEFGPETFVNVVAAWGTGVIGWCEWLFGYIGENRSQPFCGSYNGSTQTFIIPEDENTGKIYAVMTYDGSDVASFYVNGVLAGQRTGGLAQIQVSYIGIGEPLFGPTNNAYRGHVWDLKIYNIELSAERIAANYASALGRWTAIPNAPGFFVDTSGAISNGRPHSSTPGGSAPPVCAPTITTQSVPLRDIVADLFQRAGLTPDQYDVSQL